MSSVYETDALIKTGSMHPGGLRLTDRAVRLAALNPGMRAADIGCGTGETAAFLTEKHGLRVTGLDSSGRLVEIGLNNHPGLRLRRWDCRTLPFEPRSLDAIFFECTLSVLGDARCLLAQAAQALKTGGAVVVSDVCAKKSDAGCRASSLLTSDALAEALTAAGFDVTVREDHTAALRTYVAELWEKSGTGFDAGCFFGASCGLADVRLSDLGYTLMIARKI